VANLAAMYETLLARARGLCERWWLSVGGSAIDTAKALMVGTASGRFDDLIALLLAAGGTFNPHRMKALIAVPTHRRHRQRGDAVGDDLGSRGRRRSIRCTCAETWPEAAIVDAGPHAHAARVGDGAERPRCLVARAGGGLERERQPDLGHLRCPAAAREVMSTLPALLEHLADKPLRARMALAALKAGMAFLQYQDRARRTRSPMR
jgi:hypothetical protein